MVGGVNKLIDAFVGPINVTAEYVDRISKGDIPPKITDTYNGDFNEIKNNLNACIDTMNGLLAETDMLVKATVEGKFGTRATRVSSRAARVRSSEESIRLSTPSWAPQCHCRIRGPHLQGRHPPKITDTYNGDFNEIKNNLNACIDA